jgi:hypothetical protein
MNDQGGAGMARSNGGQPTALPWSPWGPLLGIERDENLNDELPLLARRADHAI